MMEKPCKVFPVSMFTDQHHSALVTMDVDQGQQSSMPEDEDDRSTLFPKFREDVLPRSVDLQGPKKSP
jgi:hypothetical protein